MRLELPAVDEYYHLLARGNNKQNIFLDDGDHVRFLFYLLFFQSDNNFENIRRHVEYFHNKKDFCITKNKLEKIVKDRFVGLINFCVMPNHFHLTVFNSEEKGISRYMHKVLTAYTKYFNTKYKKVGHVFQGPYKAVHIEDDIQLQYLSTYIHKNPKEIKGVNYETYPWSSYSDYVKKNRWGELLKPEIILDSFKSIEEYRKFIKTSVAKEEVV